MKKKSKNSDYSVDINLTPMIDCVFQLLIFFMVTTVFAVQSGLKVDLPTAASSDAPPEKDLTIVISFFSGSFIFKITGMLWIKNATIKNFNNALRFSYINRAILSLSSTPGIL